MLAFGLWFANPTTVNAASQGNLGTTSNGTMTLIYVQGIRARISGFVDMPLGTWNNSGPLTDNTDICVGRTGVSRTGTGVYRIEARGNGTSGNPAAFTLSNGASEIFYNVFFNDTIGTAGRVPLTAGVQLTGQTGAGRELTLNSLTGQCNNENANISIEVPEVELQGAIGVYTGTLTVMLIPD